MSELTDYQALRRWVQGVHLVGQGRVWRRAASVAVPPIQNISASAGGVPHLTIGYTLAALLFVGMSAWYWWAPLMPQPQQGIAPRHVEFPSSLPVAGGTHFVRVVVGDTEKTLVLPSGGDIDVQYQIMIVDRGHGLLALARKGCDD